MSTRRILTATVITTALLVACGGPDDTEPGAAPATPDTGTAGSGALTIGLTYTPDVQFSPFYVAQERGYFEDAGMQVRLRHHGASEGLFSAAISGEEALVVAGGDEMLQAVAEGADLVATATLYQDYPVVLVVPEDSDIQDVSDLPGHSVGVPGEFGQTWFGLQVLLDELGPAAEEVQVETIGFTQLAALTSGHVDTVMGFINNEPVRLQEQGVATRTLSLDDDVPLVGISLIATGEALDQDADAVQAVNDAVLRAVADIVADPQIAVEAAEQYVPDLGLDEARSAALATVEATVPLYGTGDQLGALDPDRWTQMADFMGQHGLLSRDVDVEGLLHQP